MILRKTSIFTGRETEMEFPDDIAPRIGLWKYSGIPVQDYFPDLTPDQREFLLSGATPEEWEQLFKEPE